MVLFRQRRVFVCVSALVVAATLFYAFAGARYQAHMKILVRPGRADAPVSAQENAPIDLTHLAITEEDLNSEVELLRDDQVLRKVVEENGLGGRDWLHFLRPGEGRDQRLERAARRLAKQLDVQSVKKTNLIAIRYASGDPQLAAKVLQSLANAYLQKHTVVHRPPGEFHFFEQQIADSRRQLEAAQNAILEFTSLHNVVRADQQRDLALQKLSEVDASYRQTRIDLAETQQRVWELQSRMTVLPERTTTQVHTADNPELLQALKSNLLDLKLKRTELLTKFEPNHRLVQEIDQQIAQAESAIAAENASPVRDETTDKNAHYEWAKSELERAQVQLRALQARAVATAAQEAAYRSGAQQLGEDAITQQDLENTEKAAEDNYLLYVKKQEEGAWPMPWISGASSTLPSRKSPWPRRCRPIPPGRCLPLDSSARASQAPAEHLPPIILTRHFEIRRMSLPFSVLPFWLLFHSKANKGHWHESLGKHRRLFANFP